MSKIVSSHSCRMLVAGVVMLIAAVVPSFAQDSHHQERNKILGGYFEEWSIYYAGYNIANLQQNGVAGKLTHLMYAFANVTTEPVPACSIADSWADYQTPYLPSVSGVAYSGPLYGNFAAIQQLKQLHPKLKVLMSIGGASASEHRGFRSGCEYSRRASGAGCLLYRSFCERQYRSGDYRSRIVRWIQYRLGVSDCRATRKISPRFWRSSANN